MNEGGDIKHFFILLKPFIVLLTVPTQSCNNHNVAKIKP